MSVVTITTTVSVNYYAKRSKDEINRRIDELRILTGQPPLTAEERLERKQWTNRDLAWDAIRLHNLLPE